MARVLVVEDNDDLREILAQVLSQQHQVHAVATGEEAVRSARELRPELVLLDLQLPEMDGIETGRAIKQVLGSDVAILMLTALADRKDRESVLASGCCDAYLPKPTPLGTLLEHVSRLLEGGRTPV